MINYNKEYFHNNYYFFLKDKGDKIHLYYSIADTLTESRKKDEKKEFSKKSGNKLKKTILDILKSKNKLSKKDLDKKLSSVENGEIEELVDYDGTFLNSKVPNLDLTLHPRKTMDQTVANTRVTNDPVTRGYRVYWGESEDKGNKVVSEVDYSDAFGYDETKNLDFKNTVKKLKKMGVENAHERAEEFGKLPKQKVKKDRKGKPVLKQRLSEKGSIEEAQKELMSKMVEDILAKKKKDNSDIIKKETGINKIIKKNLQSIKKIAEKEGISLTQIINYLKTDE
jgi:hypothetical protein